MGLLGGRGEEIDAAHASSTAARGEPQGEGGGRGGGAREEAGRAPGSTPSTSLTTSLPPHEQHHDDGDLDGDLLGRGVLIEISRYKEEAKAQYSLRIAAAARVERLEREVEGLEWRIFQGMGGGGPLSLLLLPPPPAPPARPTALFVPGVTPSPSLWALWAL